MRLIDADKLPIKYDGHTVSVWQVDLEKAPTVEAIPKEWVKKYANRLIELENKNYFAYRGLGDTGKSILSMLEDWEKENERP